MNDELTIKYKGETYTTKYSIDGDSLALYLPTGPISITRGGLTIENDLKPIFLNYLKHVLKINTERMYKMTAYPP